MTLAGDATRAGGTARADGTTRHPVTPRADGTTRPPVTPRADGTAPARRTARARGTAPVRGTAGAHDMTRAVAPDNAPTPDRRPPPKPEAAPFARATPPPEPPSAPFARITPPSDRPTPATPALAPPTSAPAPTSALVPTLALALGGAVREPTVLGLELALSLSLGGAIAEVGWQPPTEWDLDGRPLRIDALWLALGWHPRLAGDADTRLDAALTAVVERLTLRRLTVGAETRAVWDVGVSGDLALSRPVDARWRIGLLVGARWLPTSNDVGIPDGPRTSLNFWRVRAALTVAWSPP